MRNHFGERTKVFFRLRLIDGHISLLALSPEGTIDNSSAIYRCETCSVTFFSAVGTVESG